jgi:hypothetical protein
MHDILCIRFVGLADLRIGADEKRLRYSDGRFGKAFIVAIVWIP